jgi:26S proteasome regulatory subunit N7
VLSQPLLKQLHISSRDVLLAGIKADSVTPYLHSILSLTEITLGKTHESLLKELKETNKMELEKFEERRAETEKLKGETDRQRPDLRQNWLFLRSKQHDQ